MRILCSFLFSFLLFVSVGYPAAQCIQIYGVESDRIQPIDRFFTRLENLKSVLSNKSSDSEVVDALAQETSRTILLQLQALPKIYEASEYTARDIKNALAFRKEIKLVEGQLGFYMRQIELYDRTSPTEVAPQIVDYLKTNMAQSKIKLIGELRESGWLPDPSAKIDALTKRISKIEFKNRKKDQKRQVKALLDLMAATRSEIAELGKYFYKEKFDHEDLEAGLHTVRRALRWITVMISSSDGIYFYDYLGQRSAELDALESKYGSSKYLKIKSDSRVGLPLNREAMLQLTRLVTELGLLKDYRESQLDLNDALLAGKFMSSAKKAAVFAEQKMSERFGYINVEASARALYEEYLAKDPLKVLRRDLRQAYKAED